ncbi:PadR family transcriptional regulator [Cellulomonas oligotrophica]|uniref:DNA-binding PadR family transcriptional regulator n=2 Tax=Cellulomonas oligotrophica TaxID=931536 RepID=A0A7Y9JZF7_9CELL|nr:PadR family transcriptional regulator [Cellulomonas oligotrophica]NYD87827.1 DNA-binding PadR family transcriptional regulator [Cellulomonas oligotrophica]
MTVPMAILAFLGEQPAHGFALKQRYDTLLGHGRELRSGQVYSTLARLERDGLARGLEVERGEGPDRRVYAITDDGVTELDHWLATPHSPGARASELFTKVVLSLVAGRDAGTFLDAQRATYLARMRELTAARHDGDVVDRLARDYEMAHLEADLRWVEVATARMGEVAARIGAQR